MNLHLSNIKAILICALLSLSLAMKAQVQNEGLMSAYVSALERDLECNDDLYRERRASEFEHASVLAQSGYAQMPVDSVADYIVLLEKHDTLSQKDNERVAVLKAYQKRLCTYKDVYEVSCVKYDSLAVASAVETLNTLKAESTEGSQILEVEALMAAFDAFQEQSAMVRERFNITDARVDKRIKLYRSRTMDAVLAKSLSEDFLEPWFATEQIRILSAESQVEYIRTVTSRILDIIAQMKSLDASASSGKANELLEELLAIGKEL